MNDILASVRTDDAVRESHPAVITVNDLVRPLSIEIKTQIEAEVEAGCETAASQIEVVEVPEIEFQLPEAKVEDAEVEACVAEVENEVAEKGITVAISEVVVISPEAESEVGEEESSRIAIAVPEVVVISP